jgi:hypothetical protein
MTGDDVSVDEELVDSISAETETTKKMTVFQKILSAFFLGIFMSTPIMLLLLGLYSLTVNVLNPLRLWLAEFGFIVSILFEILVLSIIVLSTLAAILIVGYVNRAGVEGLIEISLPTNRKWVFLQGFLVLILGMILLSSLILLQLWMESSLETWSEQFPGSLGDFLVGVITGWIVPLGIILVGVLGRLVAVKLPFFRGDS